MRHLFILLVLSTFSYPSISQEKVVDWSLFETEIIIYSIKGNQEVQTIYKTQDYGNRLVVDTSIIVRYFSDTLLLEEIGYNIKLGDSTKWAHKINKYSNDGRKLEEIDSVHGALTSHNFFLYENGKLTQEQRLSITMVWDETLKAIAKDTVKTTVVRSYDQEGRCIKVQASTLKTPSSNQVESIRYDIVDTYNEFDEHSNLKSHIIIQNGDTAGKSQYEYNEIGLRIKTVDTLPFGTATSRFKYDELGNQISYQVTSDQYNVLIKTTFDDQNRVVSKKTYLPKESLPGR